MQKLPARGLYAITAQRYPDAARLLRETAAAIRGGAVMVQFRDKSDDTTWRLETAHALAAQCREHGVPLIINDDIELALACAADGVHVGRDDGDIGAVRARTPQLILGVSCYADPERAFAAADAGADYLAFGSLFPSATKPGAVTCPASLLTRARSLGRPLVAIGGITPENGTPVIEAGADFLAVIDAVFGEPDPAQAAMRFAALFHGAASGHRAAREP